MKISRQFPIRPKQERAVKREEKLISLGRQYNSCLAQRMNWRKIPCCSVKAQSLKSSIARPEKQTSYYQRKLDLLKKKRLLSECKGKDYQVLLDGIVRVKLTSDRLPRLDASSKRSGRVDSKSPSCQKDSG
jgi:hypothetical protein